MERIIRACLYARTSTEEQQSKMTITTQIEQIEQYCKLNDILLVARFLDDGVTGTTPMERRPDGARLLAQAEQGKFNLVIIYKMDRLARSALYTLQALERFKALGVKLHSLSEPMDESTPAGKMFLTQLAAFAEMERDMIAERTLRGKDRIAQDGAWNGGPALYGYVVVARNNRKFLEICEEEAEVIRMIYKLYIEDKYSILKITEYLNALGIPPASVNGVKHINVKTTGKWNSGAVVRILHRTAYYGDYVYRKRTKRDVGTTVYEVPAIISRELYELAQETAATNKSRQKHGTRQYLLTGYLRCSCCMLPLCGGILTNKKERVPYYRAAKNSKWEYKDSPHPCNLSLVRAEDVEGRVWADVQWVLRHPEEITTLLEVELDHQMENSRPVENELADIERALSAKQIERSRVIGLAKKGLISDEEVSLELLRTAREIEALEARRSELVQLNRDVNNKEEKLITAQVVLRKLAAYADTEDFDTKRLIIEGLIESVVISGHKAGPNEQRTRRRIGIVINYCFGRRDVGIVGGPKTPDTEPTSDVGKDAESRTRQCA